MPGEDVQRSIELCDVGGEEHVVPNSQCMTIGNEEGGKTGAGQYSHCQDGVLENGLEGQGGVVLPFFQLESTV